MVVIYQPVLVLLSVVVAIFGSLTALALTSGSHDADSDSVGGRLFSGEWRVDHGNDDLVDAFHRHDGRPVPGPYKLQHRRNNSIDCHCDLRDGVGALCG